jgi:hypothetical protein
MGGQIARGESCQMCRLTLPSLLAIFSTLTRPSTRSPALAVTPGITRPLWRSWRGSRPAADLSASFQDVEPIATIHGHSLALTPENSRGEPVGCEPAGGNSLLIITGKFTGNCPKIWPFGEKLPARTQQNQLVAGQIPYKMKQGINSRRTGNLLSRAGNLGNCRLGGVAAFFIVDVGMA